MLSSSLPLSVAGYLTTSSGFSSTSMTSESLTSTHDFIPSQSLTGTADLDPASAFPKRLHPKMSLQALSTDAPKASAGSPNLNLADVAKAAREFLMPGLQLLPLEPEANTSSSVLIAGRSVQKKPTRLVSLQAQPLTARSPGLMAAQTPFFEEEFTIPSSHGGSGSSDHFQFESQYGRGVEMLLSVLHA